MLGVYAWANNDGVGHSYDEIEPCANGEILQMSGGSWDCATSSGISGWEIRELSGGGIGRTAYVSCSSGKKVLGGGCDSGSSTSYVVKSYPGSDSSWRCEFSGASGSRTAYAICAYIST